MATQYFLRSAASDLGGAGQRALALARGAASATVVTSATAGGTNIPVTATAGGQAVTWFSPPLGAQSISGTVDVNIRGLESATTVNAGAGILIERVNSAGVVQSTILSDRTVPATITEYTAADAAKTSTGLAITATTFADGDRIKVTLKVRNVGTMAAGSVTNSHNGPTAAAAGDTYVTFSANIAEKVSSTLDLRWRVLGLGPNIREVLFDAGSGTNITLITGVGTKANDWLVLFHGNNFYDITNWDDNVPTGSYSDWALKATADGGNGSAHARLWVRKVDTDGSKTVTVNPAIDEEHTAHLFVMSDGDLTDIVDAVAVNSGAASLSHVAPSVSPPGATDLLLSFAQSAGGVSSYTPPPGMTEKTDISDGVFGCTGSVASEVLAASGATGTRTFTGTPTAGPFATISVALKPAGGGGGTTPVSSDLDLRWTTYARVTSDLDLRWRSIAQVTSDVDLRWRVLSRVTSDLDLRWRSLAQVVATLDLRWVSVARVTSDLDLRWKSYVVVTSDLDLRWRVATVVVSTLDLRWRSLARVTSDLDLRWRDYVVVTSDLDIRWKSTVVVTSDLDLRWVVVSSLTTVTSTLDLRWRTFQRVTSDLSMPWRSYVQVLSSHDFRWRVYGRVSSDIDLRWLVWSRVQTTMDLRWFVFQGVTTDLDLRWRVEESAIPLVPDAVVVLGFPVATVVLTADAIVSMADPTPVIVDLTNEEEVTL